MNTRLEKTVALILVMIITLAIGIVGTKIMSKGTDTARGIQSSRDQQLQQIEQLLK